MSKQSRSGFKSLTALRSIAGAIADRRGNGSTRRVSHGSKSCQIGADESSATQKSSDLQEN